MITMPNPTSLASVMQAINALGVRHPELEQLRERAIALCQEDGWIANPASVAMVFWGGIRVGKTSAEVLAADPERVLRIAREFEEAYGHAGERS